MVSSGGHYFSLLDCMAQLKLLRSNTILVLFYLADDTPTHRFFRAIQAETQTWKAVHLIPLWPPFIRPFEKAIAVLRYLSFARTFNGKKVQSVICSQFEQAYMKHLYNTIAHEKIYSLDEGNAVLRVIPERIKRLKGESKDHKLYRYLGFNLTEPPSVTFFTSYDIEVLPQDHKIDCQYEHSKKELSAKAINEDEVWVVGSDFIESAFMTKTYYLGLLRSLKALYPEKRCVYIKHRREVAENLKDIGEIMDIDVEVDIPIEIKILQQKELPVAVIGFYSAALMNIYKFAEQKMAIVGYEFDYAELLAKEHEKTIRLVYEQYRQVGITVKPLLK